MKGKEFLILVLSLVFSVALITSLATYRHEAIVNKPLMHVNFDHIDHKEVTCVTCHHNFLDDTGSGVCYVCHKQDEEVAHEIEDMFHTFCRDCHVEERQKGNVAGPVRQCKLCHEAPVFMAETQ